MIFLVSDVRWAPIFFDSGKFTVASMIGDLKRNGFDINEFNSILDFGCGCGRLLRHLTFLDKTKLYGTDYNDKLIDWCQRNISFAKIDRNNLVPPLIYENEEFDFIYARSVFTHMEEDLQVRWLWEMQRVLRPKGVFYFSTHGEQLIKTYQISDEGQKRFKTGELVVINPQSSGQNACCAFHPYKFVEDILLNSFELVDFIPGEKREYHRQDVYIARKR